MVGNRRYVPELPTPNSTRMRITSFTVEGKFVGRLVSFQEYNLINSNSDIVLRRPVNWQSGQFSCFRSVAPGVAATSLQYHSCV